MGTGLAMVVGVPLTVTAVGVPLITVMISVSRSVVVVGYPADGGGDDGFTNRRDVGVTVTVVTIGVPFMVVVITARPAVAVGVDRVSVMSRSCLHVQGSIRLNQPNCATDQGHCYSGQTHYCQALSGHRGRHSSSPFSSVTGYR